MKFLVVGLLSFFLVVSSVRCQESEGEDEKAADDGGEGSWWSRFKQRVKTVLSKWKEDIRVLWDDVLAKADDMKGWTSDMLDSLKRKLKEWIETRSELPDDEKNEIENFITKLKAPTEKPAPEKSTKQIDP